MYSSQQKLAFGLNTFASPQAAFKPFVSDNSRSYAQLPYQSQRSREKNKLLYNQSYVCFGTSNFSTKSSIASSERQKSKRSSSKRRQKSFRELRETVNLNRRKVKLSCKRKSKKMVSSASLTKTNESYDQTSKLQQSAKEEDPKSQVFYLGALNSLSIVNKRFKEKKKDHPVKTTTQKQVVAAEPDLSFLESGPSPSILLLQNCSDFPESMEIDDFKQHEHPHRQLFIQKKFKCSCKNNRCSQAYCDCLKNNEACTAELCSCTGCENVFDNHLLRVEFQHKKEKAAAKSGCSCKKSQCLKKYCECVQAGRFCGENCKCEQCSNTYEASLRQVQ